MITDDAALHGVESSGGLCETLRNTHKDATLPTRKNEIERFWYESLVLLFRFAENSQVFDTWALQMLMMFTNMTCIICISNI